MSNEGPPNCDLIVVGGSAGSISTVRRILHDLPADLGAAVMVVIHQAQISGGGLLDVLAATGSLRAGRPVDGEPLRVGHLYVAPADRHLIVEDGHLRLTQGPRENGFRPAIDVLFRTAATARGARVAAVLLSGYLDDGTMGLLYVRRGGGLTIVQDPADAEVPDMPRSAVRYSAPAHVLPAAEIGPLLAKRIGRAPPDAEERTTTTMTEAAAAAPTTSAEMDAGPGSTGAMIVTTATTAPRDTRIAADRRSHPLDPRQGAEGNDTAERGDDGLTRGPMPGKPSAVTCPQCGGELWEVHEGDLLRYQCHVGHRYTFESMRASKDLEVESALWAALRALQEQAAVQWRMAESASRANAPTLADTASAPRRRSAGRRSYAR